MKPGAMDYLVRGSTDSEKLADALRLGFAGVEVNLRREQLRSPGRERFKSLQQAASDTGAAIPSLVLGEHNGGGIGSDDPAVAQSAREDILAAVHWASDLGVRNLLVPFFFGGDLVTDEQFRRAAASFRELCPEAARRRVRLCYEGTLPAARMRELAALIGPSATNGFGCYFDLANVVWRGLDTASEIRGLGNMIAQVHMKESRVGPGDCRPGLGRVDYTESARALEEIGYDGWLVFETPGGPPELIRRDLSFARRYFPALEGAPAWPRFGAFSYGFEQGELDRLIDTWNRLGLSAVQVGSGLLQECLDSADRASEVRERLEASGISVAGIAGYRNLISPDAGAREENLQFLERCLETAPLLGTSVVATETGTMNSESEWSASPENWSPGAWRAFESAVERLIVVAQHSGAILALEGYVNNVLQTIGQLDGILGRFSSDHLQVVLDPFNYLSSHLLPAKERIVSRFLDQFESHFVLAHLKDVGDEGAEVDTPEFGSGVFPQATYLQFLRTCRPDLPIILEHLPIEHIPGAMARVRHIAGVG